MTGEAVRHRLSRTVLIGGLLLMAPLLHAAAAGALPHHARDTIIQTGVSQVQDTGDPGNRERPLVSPARAAMLSATLPGLGQIYNRRYWKVPIIYAGFGTLAYFLNMNSNEYQRWRTAYIARVDGDPNTVDGFPHSTDQLERAMRFYRRNLEVTYLLGAALYILNILDANVDAHLLDFDVREDLSLRVQPALSQPFSGYGHPAPGLSFTIKF